jgi:hypothetical protein
MTYEFYTQRGSEPGKDVEDWVSAEKQPSAEPGFALASARQHYKAIAD